jgi:hypothetical protein
MHELIPLLSGCVGGFALRSVPSLRVAVAGTVALGLIAGALATTISGEFEISPWFLLWDVGQGVIAGLALLMLSRNLLGVRPDAT